MGKKNKHQRTEQKKSTSTIPKIKDKLKKASLKQKVLFSCSIVFFIILIIVGIVFLHSKTEPLQVSTMPCILLPQNGGFVEAWTPYLPQIAQISGFPEVTIKTYSGAGDLEAYFSKAASYNMLWAEIPLDGNYYITRLAQKHYFSEITNDAKNACIPAVVSGIKRSFFAFTDKAVPCLPLSINPWLLVSHKNAPETLSGSKAEYNYSIAGLESETAFAALAASRTLFTNQTVSLETSVYSIDNIESATKRLQTMANNLSIQANSQTYTRQDSKTLFTDGYANQWLVSSSEFNTINVSDCIDFTIMPEGSCVIADCTAAFFPSKQTNEIKAIFPTLQQFLVTSDIQYPTANGRHYLPAATRSISFSVYSDYVKSMCISAQTIIIPLLQYETASERTELFENIQRALVTLKINSKSSL